MMKAKNWRGTALIEFAILIPVLCLILFGIIEFGIIIYDQNIITNASRAGARYGVISLNSVYPSSSTVSTYIKNSFTANLVSFKTPTPLPTITIASSTTPPVAGAQLTVTVSYPYYCLVINKLAGLTSPIILNSTTVMIYE